MLSHEDNTYAPNVDAIIEVLAHATRVELYKCHNNFGNQMGDTIKTMIQQMMGVGSGPNKSATSQNNQINKNDVVRKWEKRKRAKTKSSTGIGSSSQYDHLMLLTSTHGLSSTSHSHLSCSSAFILCSDITKIDNVVKSTAITMYYVDHVFLSMETLYARSLTVDQLHTEGAHSMYMAMVFYQNVLHHANDMEQMTMDLKMKLEEARDKVAKANDVVSTNMEHALRPEKEEVIYQYESEIAELKSNESVLAFSGWENVVKHVMNILPTLDVSLFENPTSRNFCLLKEKKVVDRKLTLAEVSCV
ncbi:hypothetical protein ACFE04_007847 [Oxalis oulophora]